MKPRLRLLLLTAWVSLFFSGLAAGIYSLAWMRYLAALLGSSAFTWTVGLVAILGGLAAGQLGLGRLADRVLRPLASSAWIQVSLGLYALLFPFYFHACSSALERMIRLVDSALVLRLMEGMLGLAVLLVPSVLLGGILPVLARLAAEPAEKFPGRFGGLCFVHILGIVLGGWLASFWLIPGFGLASSMMAGAVLNLVAGAMAFLVSARWETVIQVAGAAPLSHLPTAPPPDHWLRPERILALLAAGLTGLGALLCWVVWSRLLALSLGPTPRVSVLAFLTLLGGVALGGGGMAWRPPLANPSLALARLLLGSSLYIFVSMFIYDLLPWWAARWTRLLAHQPDFYWLVTAGHVVLVLGVILPPALAWGMTAPVALRLAAVSAARAGQSAGRVLAVQAVGALLGWVAGTWILLPIYGLATSLAAGLCLFAALSLALLRERLPAPVHDRLAWGYLAALLGLILLSLRLTPHWQRTYSIGWWQWSQIPPSLSQYRALVQARQLAYYREGAEASVGLQLTSENAVPRRRWRVNGQLESAADGAGLESILSSHLPMLLHARPENVLLAGATAGSCQRILRHDSVQQLHVVEPSSEFIHEIRKQVKAPAVRLHAENARSYLLRSQASYDLIISGHTHPWRAGEADFLSVEFFEQCRRRLRPGGLVAQRITLAGAGDRVLDILIATFTSVFPWTSLWQSGPEEWMLIGSVHPLSPDLLRLEKRFEASSVKADFERIDLLRLPVLLAHELLGQQNTMFAPGPDTPRHSDYYPALPRPAQYAFLVRPGAPRYRQLDERSGTRPATLWSPYVVKNPLAENDFEALALGLRHLESETLYRSLLEGWQERFPQTLLPLELYGRLLDYPAPGLLAASRLAPALHSEPPPAAQRPELLSLYARALLVNYRQQRSLFHRPDSAALRALLERLIALDPHNQRAYKLHLAELAWDEGRDDLCLRWGRSALHPDLDLYGPIQFQIDPAAPGRVLTWMIEALWRAGQLGPAWDLAQEAQRHGYASPDHVPRHPVLEMVCRKIQTFHAQMTRRQTAAPQVGGPTNP